jgi:hypothetical protein
MYWRFEYLDGGRTLPQQVIRAQSGKDDQVQGEPQARRADQAAGTGLRKDEGDLRQHD